MLQCKPVITGIFMIVSGLVYYSIGRWNYNEVSNW